MADITDTRIEERLRRALRVEAESLPLTVRPEDFLRRRRTARVARDRRPLRLLAIAAAAALPVAAVIGLSLSTPDVDEPSYGAVLVRGLERVTDTDEASRLEVILVLPGGEARGLVRYDSSRFPGLTDVHYPKVSEDGWLAFDAYSIDAYGEHQVLVDLKDLSRDPVILDGSALMGWSPDGMLWRYANGRYERLDPETGILSSAPEPGDGLGPGGSGTWALATAADGSGAVVQRDPEEVGVTQDRSWGVFKTDGSVTHGRPDVAEGTGPRLLTRDGGLLQVCESDPAFGSYCPELARGSVVSGPGEDGSFRTWGDGPGADEYVLGASWAADGGTWQLVDRRRDGRAFAVVHVAPDGKTRTAATFAADHASSVSIDGLASDDSLIAIGWIDEDGWWTALVDVRSGTTYLLDGQVAGFVDRAAAEAWMPGEFAVERAGSLPRTPPPGSPRYPALPPVEEQAVGADAILLVHESPATADRPGSPVSIELGPVALESGYGISLVCSGPGDVTYTLDTDPWPVLKHCQDGFEDDRGAPGATEETISLVVTADPATTWRIVVYDPPPGSYGS
ncbi:hypothetical protein BH23CHL8_BH23CHL8_14790 [soil metagenome]